LEACGKHVDKGSWKGEGVLNKPIKELNISKKFWMLQIDVEITLNERCNKIINSVVAGSGEVFS
jgi:hypothetical protein